MFVGDLCLNVIPASRGDSKFFVREMYPNVFYEGWRLLLLLMTGLAGMVFDFLPCGLLSHPYSRSTARHILRF